MTNYRNKSLERGFSILEYLGASTTDDIGDFEPGTLEFGDHVGSGTARIDGALDHHQVVLLEDGRDVA